MLTFFTRVKPKGNTLPIHSHILTQLHTPYAVSIYENVNLVNNTYYRLPTVSRLEKIVALLRGYYIARLFPGTYVADRPDGTVIPRW